MKNVQRISLSLALVMTIALGARAQRCDVPAPPPDKANTLIIDARPSQPNRVSGKTLFKKEARVAVINMNPFLYTYVIDTKQTQIKDTAHVGFLKLLGPVFTDVLGNLPLETFARETADASRGAEAARGNLEFLARVTCYSSGVVPGRAGGAPVACDIRPTVAAGCGAATGEATQYLTVLRELTAEVLTLNNELAQTLRTTQGSYAATRTAYEKPDPSRPHGTVKETLYDPDTSAADLCEAVNYLRPSLTPAGSYPSAVELAELRSRVDALRSLARQLEATAEAFSADDQYKNCIARTRGLNYIANLSALAEKISGDVTNAYVTQVTKMEEETSHYDSLKVAIAKLDNNEDVLLQQTFDVTGKFDISALDITVTPQEINRGSANNARGGGERSGGEAGRAESNGVSGRTEAAAARAEAARSVATTSFTRAETSSAATGGNEQQDGGGGQQSGGGRTAEPTAQAQIGNRRFEVSGGLAYTSHEKREFQPVLGFARDVQGGLTNGQTLTRVVGVKEDSRNRLAPLVMLNTRLTDNPTYNLFFSFGITGKKDNAGTDIEYMLGPSVNFLNNRLFFTAGTYAGKQQVLAGDLFLNAALPTGQNDVPVRKEFHWKPAVALTYRFPVKLR